MKMCPYVCIKIILNDTVKKYYKTFEKSAELQKIYK